MPELVGTIQTFSGDPDETFYVSRQAIAAQCTEFDTTVPPFLEAVVTDYCDGYFSTAQQILDDAQQAARTLTDVPFLGDSCLWLKYYAPLVMRSYFEVPSTPIGDFQGYWRVTAKEFRITGATTIPPDFHVECYYGVWDIKEWQFRGKVPTVVDGGTDELLCGHPLFDKIQIDELEFLSSPAGSSRFKKGSVSFVLLTDDTEYSDPGLGYVPGGAFMPIPPIPDGYPAPPPTPPLQGSAIVEALSDDDCVTIVQRGGGFRSLYDIANYTDATDWDEFDYYCLHMFIPTEHNYSYFLQLVENVPTEFWASLNLGQTGGGSDYVLTLQAMIDAFNEADEDTQKAWLQDNTTNWIFFDILNAFVLADTEQTLRQKLLVILRDMLENPIIFEPVVELHYDLPNSNISFSIDTEGKLKMIIKLGRDTMGNDNEITEILARYCNGDRSIPTAALSARTELGGIVNDAKYKQLVVDLLYQIRECCNPCAEPFSENQYDEDFWGDHTSFGEPSKSLSMQVPDLYRVTFQVLENHQPKVVYFGTPPLLLLAKFAWLDSEGRWGEIQYVNLDHTTFVAPSKDIIGYICHCYVGVSLHAQVGTRGGATHVDPNAPT